MGLSAERQQEIIQQEIVRHQLPSDFYQVVTDYYQPLVKEIIHQASKSANAAPLFVGIQGTQGSGKSTCAAFLKLLFETQWHKPTLVMSIDDFYLTRAERQALAQQVHPLLVTRGVPGTHDIGLLQTTLEACSQRQSEPVISVPVFDKASDDRAPVAQWQSVTEPVDIIILEGWCVGLTAQDEAELAAPINALEADEDADQQWRRYVNQHLANEYTHLYAKFDCLVALQAPSFDCVFDWRRLQEQKLLQRLTDAGQDTSKVQSEDELRRFISHYERLTRHALKIMPKMADYLLVLREDHGFSQLITNKTQDI